MNDDSPMDFEASIEHLSEIIKEMEGGALPLDKALKSFEKGVKLIHQCQITLAQAEKNVKILTEQHDGSAQWSSLSHDLKEKDD